MVGLCRYGAWDGSYRLVWGGRWGTVEVARWSSDPGVSPLLAFAVGSVSELKALFSYYTKIASVESSDFGPIFRSCVTKQLPFSEMS